TKALWYRSLRLAARSLHVLRPDPQTEYVAECAPPNALGRQHRQAAPLQERSGPGRRHTLVPSARVATGPWCWAGPRWLGAIARHREVQYRGLHRHGQAEGVQGQAAYSWFPRKAGAQRFSTHQVYSTTSSVSGRMVNVMKRTAMELAALASAAMPGLDIVQATASPDDQRAFDSAIVTDSDNNHWRVRSPRNSQAAFRLETEIQVLSGFTPAIRAHLPFRVPSVAGAVQIDSLRRFIYH